MSILPSHKSEFDKKLDDFFGLKLDKFDLSVISNMPYVCHKSLLPYLAVSFDISIDNLNEQDARELLANAFKIHYYEGTLYSLKSALKAFFGDSEIFEWHEYNGKPYHFKVKGIDITNSGTDKNALNHLDKTINEYKNVRSVCESIELTQNKKFKQFVGVAFNVAVSVNLYPSVETKLESIFTKEISSYTHTQETINLA